LKLNKKLVLLLAVISLAICISLIQSTYAKYVTQADANASLTIARWNILVNNQDVIAESDFSDVITPAFLGSTHIKSGVIAPTAEGYFDVTINGENTDVSYQYSLIATLSDQNTVTDLRITKYEIEGIEYAYTHGDAISDTVLFNQSDKTITIRFHVSWYENSIDETMDNEADTLATISGVAAVAVNLHLVQVQ